MESQKLRKRKKIREQRYINRVFKLVAKKVYRSLKEEGKKPIKDMPSKEEVSNFWSQLWEIPVQHNEDADWMNTLKEGYCRDAQQYHYEITDEVLERILKPLANDKPGRDQVAGIWLKRIKSLKHHYKEHLIHLLKSEAEPPEWLLTSKTLLLPKNEITSQAKNYRPIALQNTMYKVYTALLVDFIMDHCEKNGIVTEEQAAGKRGSWGCSDQLLINKMIQEQVIANRKNLVTVWLDYQKAFDGIPHSWLIRRLELAKVPEVIINAIKKLTLKWRTNVFLHGENTSVETDFINYLRGILQGDSLSLILFVLSVNRLSFLLKEHDGYKTNSSHRL